MLILGGSINTQLGKDLQRFGRIASANADPVERVIDTQLGKDPQRLWKDPLCQC